MKRRKFLQNILKVTALASVPVVVINEIIKDESSEYPFVSSGDWQLNQHLTTNPDAEFKIIFDEEEKTISFENPPKEGVRLDELYRYMQDEWEHRDEPYEFPFPTKLL
jgi:predicted membrane GTPase involved in stress response